MAAINPSKTEVAYLDPSTEVSFVPMEAVGEDASLDTSRLKPISEVSSGYTYFRDGDILIAKITPCFENGKATLARGLIGGFGFGSTEFHVVRPSASLDARFAFYMIRSNGFRDRGAASMYGAGGQKRVPTDFIADFPVALPPLPKQNAIADFLDRETGKIDALIAKQEELVANLIEKRAQTLWGAVTKGISGAPLKATGVQWIGSIPKHWEARKLVQLAKLESGHTPSRQKPEYWENCDIPWVSLADVHQFRDGKREYIEDTSEKISRLGMANSAARLLPAGTVILSRTASVGFSTILGKDMATTQDFVNWICGSQLNNRYLLRCFWSMGRDFERLFYGSTHKTIYMPDVRTFTIPTPPLNEQLEIVAFLDAKLGAIDSLIQKAQEAVSLLSERRSALITATVTGRFDVVATSTLNEPTSVAANDDRQALRVVVGAEIVSRQGAAKNFGRVKLQKLLYLAEVHAGIHELAGNYVRQAAGPLSPDLLSETERGMEAAGFYRTVPPTNETDGYNYSRIGKAGAHGDRFAALLGDRAAALTQLIDRFRDYDKRQVEAITTLYAVWNDALLDGEKPTDDRIIRGVLEEWHPEKKDKFTVADLKPWLAWMRRNGVVPTGTGSRTKLDRLFV